MATRSSILAWKFPWTEEPGVAGTVRGVAKTWPRLSLSTSSFSFPDLVGDYECCNL